MKRTRIALALAILSSAAIPCAGLSAAGAGIEIQTSDVDLFFRVYDAAGGRPTADQLQHDYLDAGSEGLHELARRRNVTGVRIAQSIEAHPEIYTSARECMAALPRVRARA